MTMTQLKDGDRFPSLAGQSVAHGAITLPDALAEGSYGVILAYRAHW
jgi:hypothetical protein